MSKKSNNKLLNYSFLILILTIGFPFQSLPVYSNIQIQSDVQIINGLLGNGFIGKSIFDPSTYGFIKTETPIAFAQTNEYPIVIRNETSLNTQLSDTRHVVKLGMPTHIQNNEGEWVADIFNEDDDTVQLESAKISYSFSKSACSMSMFDVGRITDESIPIIKSNNWVAKVAINGTDLWFDVSQNSLPCTVTTSMSGNGFIINSTKSDSLGTITEVYHYNRYQGMKETVYFTNNDTNLNNHKFSFSNIIQDVPPSMIYTTSDPVNAIKTNMYSIYSPPQQPVMFGGNATVMATNSTIKVLKSDFIFNDNGTDLQINDRFAWIQATETEGKESYRIWEYAFSNEDDFEKLSSIKFVSNPDLTMDTYVDFENVNSTLAVGETTTIDPTLNSFESFLRVGLGSHTTNCNRASGGFSESTQFGMSMSSGSSIQKSCSFSMITFDISSIPADATPIRGTLNLPVISTGCTPTNEIFVLAWCNEMRANRYISWYDCSGEDLRFLPVNDKINAFYKSDLCKATGIGGGIVAEGGAGTVAGALFTTGKAVASAFATTNPHHVTGFASQTQTGAVGFGDDPFLIKFEETLEALPRDNRYQLGMSIAGVGTDTDNWGLGFTYSTSQRQGGVTQVWNVTGSFLEVEYEIFSTPSPPQNVTCEQETPTSVFIDWTAVAFDGGRPVTEYIVERDSGGGFVQLQAGLPLFPTNFVDNTIISNIGYVYRLGAVNGEGIGTFSNGTQACGIESDPSNPFGLDAQNAGLNIVALSWFEPLFTGNTVMTGYKIQRTTGTAEDTGSDWQSIKHHRQLNTVNNDGVQVILNAFENTSRCMAGEILETSEDPAGLVTSTDVTLEGLCLGTGNGVGGTDIAHNYLFKTFTVDQLKNRDIRVLWEQFRQQHGSSAGGSPQPMNQCTNTNNPSPCDTMNVKMFIVDGEYDMQGANVVQSGGDFEAGLAGTHVTGEIHIPPVGNGILHDCLDDANSIVNIVPPSIATNPDEHVTQTFPLLSFINQQGVHDVTCQVDDLSDATQPTVTVVFMLYDLQGGSIQFSPFGANAGRFTTGVGAVIINNIQIEGLGLWQFNDDLPNPTTFAYGHDNQFETNTRYSINIANPTQLTARHEPIPDATYVKKGIEVKPAGSSIGQTVKHVAWDLLKSGAPTQDVFVEIWDSGADLVQASDDILLAKSTSFITLGANSPDGFQDTTLLSGGYVRKYFTLNTGVVLDTNDRIVLSCPDCTTLQGVPFMKTNPNTANSPLMPAGFGTTWLNGVDPQHVAFDEWAIFGGQNSGNTAFGGQIGHSPSNSLINGLNTGQNSIALITSGEFTVGEGFITIVENTGNNFLEFLDTTVAELTTYGYRVFGINNLATSTLPSNTAIVTTAGAPQPPEITTEGSGTSTIFIQWTTPDLGGGELIEYEIERKLGTGGILQFIDVTTETEFNDGEGLFALLSAQEYCYQIKTITNVGSSIFSDESCATTFDAPSPVTNFIVTALDGSTAEMSFDDPISNGGSPLTGFKIELKIGAGAFNIVQPFDDLNKSRNDTGLPIGTLIQYRVSPFNQFGAGDPATESAITDATPQPPPNFTCSASSASTITLDWETPETFSAPTGYQIDRRNIGGSFSSIDPDTANTNTQFIDGGLAVDDTFEYRVRGHTTEGDTDFTPIVRCVTLSAPDFPPEDLQGDFTATIPHQMVLAWDIPETFGVPITSFRIERDDGAGFVQLATVSSSTFVFIDQDPANAVTQSYRVFTVGGEGDSPPTIAIPFSANQVSHWGYEKGIDDTGGNKNAGIITGTANFDNAGINGRGLLFDGSTYITVEEEEDYDFDNIDSFGITTYYRGNSTGVDQVLVSKGGTMSDRGYRMFIDDTGVLGIRLTNAVTSNELHIIGSTNVTDNALHFLGIGYDGNNDESGLSLMVDGIFETKNVITNSLSATILNDKPIVLGANDGGGNKLTGLLDDTRIFGSGTLDNATLQAVADNNINTVIPINATFVISGATFSNISRETSTIIMTSGYPIPTVNTIDLFNFTATNVNTNTPTGQIDSATGIFVLDPEFFNVMSSQSNYTATTSLTNSEETLPLLSNFDLQIPLFTFTGDFFFQQERNDDFTILSFNYTQTQIPFDLACNFKSTLFSNGTTVLFTDVFFVQLLQDVPQLEDVVVACIDQNSQVVDITAPSFGGSNTILSFVSFGDTTGVGNFLQFTNNYGDFFGVGLPFLFVIILAAAFTGRSAPTGILIIGIAIGIMWAMGIIDVDPFMWGIIIVLIILGVLGGKKFL